MDEEVASVTIVAAPSGNASDNDYGVFDDTQGDQRGALKGTNAKSDGAQRDLGILVFVGLASIIEFWQAADLCSNDNGMGALYDNCSGRNGYAVAAGGTSFSSRPTFFSDFFFLKFVTSHTLF